MLVLLLLLSSLLFLTFIYVTGKNNENYWKKRGVKFYQKNKVTGVFWDFLVLNKPVFQSMGEIYKEHREEPAVGFGGFLTPTLLVNDATNIQHVFQTDFQAFNHRGLEINEGDHLADNILFMNGDRWKLVRQSMTPIFTSAKLKKMFYIIDKSGKDFVTYLKNNPDRLNGNAFDTLATYCCATVGAAVFGVVSDSVFDSPFLDATRIPFEPTLKSNIKAAIMNLSPWLSKKLNIKLFSEYEEFFIGAVKRMIRQREQESGQKHDFADICVSLKRKGTLKDRETGLEMEPTDELLSGQAFIFFSAGVDPSAAAFFACLLELGRNPKHLEKVHNEVDMTLKALNGKLTYESVMEMKYLEKVLCESLRLWPPVGFLGRQCVDDSLLPVGNIWVEKGTKIFVPLYELHHDPKYYPNPEVFDPERFASESVRDSSMYMPFGKGNRLCVGMKFARLQVKTGLIYFLHNFTVKTKLDGDELRFRKDQILAKPINIDIKFIPRNRDL